jgi:hypothetical protein
MMDSAWKGAMDEETKAAVALLAARAEEHRAFIYARRLQAEKVAWGLRQQYAELSFGWSKEQSTRKGESSRSRKIVEDEEGADHTRHRR